MPYRESGRTRWYEAPVLRAFVLLISTVCWTTFSYAAGGGLVQQVADAWSRTTYQPLAEAERASVEMLFEQLLSGSDRAAQEARKLGMELSRSGGGMLLLRESGLARMGRGIYAFRQSGRPAPVLLQAPHARSDKHTGKLAALLMEEHPLLAMAVNTAPRRMTPDSDLAHQPESWMMAQTRAFARAYPHGSIIQLHGFATAKRRTVAARNAAYIVSPGHLDESVDATRLARCLQENQDGRVRLYPQDVSELGGTTNSMSRWLRRAGHLGFIHVEIADHTRTALLKSESLRGVLGRCLEARA